LLQFDQTGDRSDHQTAGNHNQRHYGGDFWHPLHMLPIVDEGQLIDMKGMEHQLHTDKSQDCGNTVVQIDKLIEETSEQEVQLTEPHESKNIRGKDDEGVLCNTENCWNGIDGKHHVGGTNRNEHTQHRGKES